MASPSKDPHVSHAELKIYKLVSATYLGKFYPEGLLLVDASRREIELREWVGKKKREQAVVARFRLEPHAVVLVEGATVKVHDLAVTLESSSVANEAASLFNDEPTKEVEEPKPLQDAVSAAMEFLKEREEAVGFFHELAANPRSALLGAESMWTDQSDPLDAVYAGYSGELAESLGKLKSSLADSERTLGPGASERLYAFIYTLGAIQNAMLAPDSTYAQEIAALKEFGISATVQELRAPGCAERLMERAHSALLASANV